MIGFFCGAASCCWHFHFGITAPFPIVVHLSNVYVPMSHMHANLGSAYISSKCNCVSLQHHHCVCCRGGPCTVKLFKTISVAVDAVLIRVT